MSADVFALSDFRPAPLPPRAGAPLPHPRRVYGFSDMVRKLALAELTVRTQIDYLRAYAAEWGMPLPLNARRRKGHLIGGPDCIGQRSRWCAMTVDAWFDLRNAPAVARAADTVPPVPMLARTDMAARAAQLAGR